MLRRVQTLALDFDIAAATANNAEEQLSKCSLQIEPVTSTWQERISTPRSGVAMGAMVALHHAGYDNLCGSSRPFAVNVMGCCKYASYWRRLCHDALFSTST